VKISCPSCSAKYSIADEKVQSRLAKIRCRKCGTSIVIDGNVSPANVYAADAGASASAGAVAPVAPAVEPAPTTTYSVDLGESDQRQMTVPEIVAAYNDGTVTPETFVWADGFADWTALSEVEEIVASLHSAAAQDSPTAPTDEVSAAGASTAPQENPWEAGGLGAPAAPAESPPASGGGADLFGGVAEAGGEADQTSDPSPFGAAAAAAPADTGARNESSVLFSLSALTSGATASRPSSPLASVPPSAVSNNDDSGLIDLKALTSAADASASPLAAPSPLAAAPLGATGAAASPLGGPSLGSGASIPPQSSGGSKNVIILGGFGLVAAIAVAVITQMGGSPEPEVAPAASAVPIATAATAAPVAAAPTLPTTEAKAPSTGTEEDEAAPKKKSGSTAKRTTRRRTGGTAKKATSGTKSTAKPKPRKKKSTRSKCGCKKDDLMCMMNCAQ